MELSGLKKVPGLENLEHFVPAWDDFKREFGLQYQGENAAAEDNDRAWFAWHSFRGEHRSNSCLLNASGQVIGLIIKKTQLQEMTLPSLPALVYLCICDNGKLVKLEFGMEYPLLEHIDLRGNRLEALELMNVELRALTMLDISRNSISNLTLPTDLPVLQELDASGNMLKHCKLAGELPALRYLYLEGNDMETLDITSNLRVLINLNLRDNQLSKLPDATYDALETLYVKGNPLKGFEEVLINGDDSGNAFEIIAQLRSMAITGSRPNYRAKLVIVGNGRVGKTSLLRRLKGEAFDAGEKYTHGVVISEMNESHFPEVKTDKLVLKVWDFGGQEVFYATHQFFMSEEALYVYAWTDKAIAEQNKEKDTEASPWHRWREHAYWLDNVRMHSMQSPLLIIKTHNDEAMESFPNELKVTEPGPYLNFDAANFGHKNVDNIRAAIAEGLNKLPLLGASVPINYHILIEYIESLRQRGKQIMYMSEFRPLGIALAIPEKDYHAVLSYLHKTGEVVYFDRDGLRETIYINPVALTQRLYKLIEGNDLLENNRGEFDENHAENMFNSADWHDLLLLLQSFSLIFPKSGSSGKKFIAPQYLPDLEDNRVGEKERRLFMSHQSKLTLRFTLYFPHILPENIMVNLLSTYGPYSEDFYYKDAIYFVKEQDKDGCVIRSNEEMRQIEIYTKVSKEGNEVARSLFEELKKLGKKAEVHISAGDNKWVKAKLLENKNNQVFATTDGESTVYASVFTFLLHEEGPKSPDPPSLIQKTMKKIFISYSHRDNTTHGTWIEAFKKRLEDDYHSRYGQELDIFFDKVDNRTGNVLSKKIESALAESALLIPILTSAYLNSEWCRKEFLDFSNKTGSSLYVGDTSGILPVRIMPWEEFDPPEEIREDVNTIKMILKDIVYKDFHRAPLPIAIEHADFNLEIAKLSEEIHMILS
jgi:hypothetical protein